MDKKYLKLTPQNILPGYESGRYELARQYDSSEFGKPQLEDPLRRDNRISIRVSGVDMTELHRLALEEGVPVQSLIAHIVHQYVNCQTGRAAPEIPRPLQDSKSSPDQDLE